MVCFASGAVVLLAFARGADAQRPSGPATTWPIDSVLARFARDRQSNTFSSTTYEILALPAGFAARQDSLLNGLERLASADDRYVAAAAAGVVAFAGQIRGDNRPIPGILPRLVRVYESQLDADPRGVRLAIRNRLPLQADRRAAVALLRAIATQPNPNGPDPVHGYFPMGDPRTEALARLAEMGDEGRAALQAMHQSGEARSPQARIILDQMAQRGFPVIDAIRLRAVRDDSRSVVSAALSDVIARLRNDGDARLDGQFAFDPRIVHAERGRAPAGAPDSVMLVWTGHVRDSVFTRSFVDQVLGQTGGTDAWVACGKEPEARRCTAIEFPVVVAVSQPWITGDRAQILVHVWYRSTFEAHPNAWFANVVSLNRVGDRWVAGRMYNFGGT